MFQTQTQQIDLSPYTVLCSSKKDENHGSSNLLPISGAITADEGAGENDSDIVGSRHQLQTMKDRKCTTMQIRCLLELTPLDMMDLSFGIADPTGSCIWLGAFFFLEIFARDLDLHFSPALPSLTAAHSRLHPCAIEMRQYLAHLRNFLFPPSCKVLELGSGTGMSGLSLLAVDEKSNVNKEIETTGNGSIQPSILVLTDANEDSLELCRMNLDLNLNDSNDGKSNVFVQRLEWGEGNAAKVIGASDDNGTTIKENILEGDSESRNKTCQTSPEQQLPASYDTVFATDVLYDLSSLVPLVNTASELLAEGGYFILSHVPRASVPKSMSIEKQNNTNNSHETEDDDNACYAVGSSQQLEPIIIREASKVNLSIASFPPTYERFNPDITAIFEAHGNEKQMILRPTLLSYLWDEIPLQAHSSSSSVSKKNSWRKMIEVGAAILVFQKK